MNSALLRDRLADCKEIPSLPRQAHRLLQSFSDPDLDNRQIARIISDHPTIVARLIALANSAWAAPAQPVSSIERACINLGLTIVRSVSIALAVIAPFNTALCPAFDLQRFWISSKLVSDTAILLANTQSNPPSDVYLQNLYTSGLLHNLGIICLAHLMPGQTQQAFERIRSNPDLTVNQAIFELIQTDYCEVGGLFAERWGLPTDLVNVIKFHRNADYQGDQWQQSAFIGSATELVSNLLNQSNTLSEPVFNDKLAIPPDAHQQVYKQLKPLLLKASEIAKVLF